MMHQTLLSLVVVLSSLSSSYAIDPPFAEAGSFAVCVLSDKQCAVVPGGVNFGSKKSPGGNCVGWVNVTQTLLANIYFDPNQSKNPAITKRAIVDAFRKGTIQVIPGYSSLNELIAEADSEWLEYDKVDEQKKGQAKPNVHPVQQAVIELQSDQPGPLKQLFQKLKLKERLTSSSTSLNETLDARIRAGMPVILGITPKGGGGHAILAVGLESKSESEVADKFYIVDPNHPKQMQLLKYESVGVPGYEDMKIWVYEADDWQPGSPREIDAARRQAVTMAFELSVEKSLIKRTLLQNKLNSKVAELKKLMGTLEVQFLNDKEKNRELLKLAFDAHKLPTDPPDPEQLARVFGNLFGLVTACKVPESEVEGVYRMRAGRSIQQPPGTATLPNHNPPR